MSGFDETLGEVYDQHTGSLRAQQEGFYDSRKQGETLMNYQEVRVRLSVAAPSDAPPGVVSPVPVFEVEDIAAVRAKITEMGATVLDERDMGDHGRTLAFAAPNGQVLQLLQRA